MSEAPRILSPYGKDALRELANVYGFASPGQAAEFVVQHIRHRYALRVVAVETLHIAYGLTARLSADEGSYYLKFASRGMHANPAQLFPWLSHLRRHGLPVPPIIPTLDGRWYTAPLPRSDYDVVYLMGALPGSPPHEAHPGQLQQYAEAMARFHQVGSRYPAPVDGSRATWASKWAERERLWIDLSAAPHISRDLVAVAMRLIEDAGPRQLSSTVIHGDFRLCHVLFQDGALTGIIDVDQSTSGERWVDLCYGLLSGADPEKGSLLSFSLLRDALRLYHRQFPLTGADRAALLPAFAYAGLETLRDLLPGVLSGSAAPEELTVTQDLLDTILSAPGDLL